MRYPASLATLESTPSSTMMNAIARAGATFTSFRISAAISPAFSATPTPIIATKITATTLKFASLQSIDTTEPPRGPTASSICKAVLPVPNPVSTQRV